MYFIGKRPYGLSVLIFAENNFDFVFSFFFWYTIAQITKKKINIRLFRVFLETNISVRTDWSPLALDDKMFIADK